MVTHPQAFELQKYDREPYSCPIVMLNLRKCSRRLVSELLVKDEELHKSFYEICEHPYFINVNHNAFPSPM